MRILAASDFHGHEIVSRGIAKKVEKEEADIVVIAGDILNFGAYAKNMLKPIVEKGKGILIVPGNHDTEEAIDAFVSKYNVKSIHGNYAIVDNVGFFGCGGTSMPFFPYFIPEKHIFSTLKKGFKKIKSVKKKVMITHIHPAGSMIEKFSIPGSGSEAVRKAIKEFKPDTLICGHIHEMEGFEEKMYGTVIYSVGRRGTVIEI